MYFMEKIQLQLSNDKALEAIKRVTNALGASLLGDHIDNSKKGRSLSPKQASFQERKKEEFKLRLNTIKQATQNNAQTPPKIDNLLKDHEEKSKKLSEKKKVEIDAQEDELKERLRNRQTRSFQKSFTMNRSYNKPAVHSKGFKAECVRDDDEDEYEDDDDNDKIFNQKDEILTRLDSVKIDECDSGSKIETSE